MANCPPAKSRVYIVDSDGLIRRGLADLIRGENDMDLCGEAEDANSAFNTIMKVTPDIVTIEISLAGADGLQLVKSIRGLERKIGILVISNCDEFVYAERALRAGAHGFVNKQTGVDTIPEAIRHILTGAFAFTPSAEQAMRDNFVRRHGPRDASVGDLSDRELEVGICIGAGATTREIAIRLGLSVKTIETHRSNMKRKLGLPNAARLAHFWIEWAALCKKEPAEVDSAGFTGNGKQLDRPLLPRTRKASDRNGEVAGNARAMHSRKDGMTGRQTSGASPYSTAVANRERRAG